MKNSGVLLASVLVPLFAASASAQVVAHWQFDRAGRPGEATSPDVAIADLSGNANDLYTFSADTAPRFATTQPADHVVLDFTPRDAGGRRRGGPRRDITRDLYVRHPAPDGQSFNLNRGDLQRWTIEARVLFQGTAGWERRFQTFVGRDGYNLPNTGPVQESPLSNLGFKKLGGEENRIAIEAWDSGRNYVSVRSIDPVKPDVWYDLAAVSDGKTLTLWLKGPGDATYLRQADTPFAGALLNGGGIWTVGRGFFGNAPSEQFAGYVAEVRISANAMEPDQFLAANARGNSIAQNIPATQPAASPEPVAPSTFPPAPSTLVGAHDPTMLRDGDTFHLFASHNGIGHWRSKDLIHWEALPSVFPNGTPAWAQREISDRAGLWAPDVLFFNGRFHLYYSSSTFGSQRSAIGLATNATLDPEDPRYKWEDQGKVIESFPRMPFNAIDPAVLLDAERVPWMAFGSWNKGIFITRLDPTTGKAVSGFEPVHLASRPKRDALEAPSLYRHDGWYYLTVSFDNCCRGANSTYKLVIGRSRQITGPYVDRDGRPMLEGNGSLLLRTYSFTAGPGQNTFVDDGDRTWMVHHYYDARDNGIPRAQMRPVYFDDDGWPLVGEPVAESHGAPAPGKSVVGQWQLWIDEGKPLSAELREDGTVTSGSRNGRWSLDGSKLVVTWTGETVADKYFVAEDRDSCVGRRSDGAIVRAVRVSGQ